ncbi:MAG: DUF1684 domain-containing protein [Acidimicrobiia bacterium]
MDEALDGDDILELWDYRRRTAEMYRAVRQGGAGADTWRRWRNDRDRLFATHPQSAIEPEQRPGFSGLSYFDHDPGWRFEVDVEPLAPSHVDLSHSGAGTTEFREFGRVGIYVGDQWSTLTLFWLGGYGGGVFLPFRDATSGDETYGGGRYLIDSAKGADLGHQERTVVLDFNYAYHPSCVHSSRWSCPLAPVSNRLPVAVRAGERLSPDREA